MSGLGAAGILLRRRVTTLGDGGWTRIGSRAAAKQVKGSLKEAIGALTGKADAEAEGQAEQRAGKAQEHAGKARDRARKPAADD